MADETTEPLSLDSERIGTHVDFVAIELVHKVDADGKPWFYSNTSVDLSESYSLVDSTIAALEAAGRTIVAVTPISTGTPPFCRRIPGRQAASG